MPYKPFSFPLTGGMDRSVVPCKANPASFYNLINMRPSRDAAGSLEQTPRFYLESTVNRVTYWNGSSSVSEDTTNNIVFSQDCGNIGWVNATTTCLSLLGNITIPVYQQTTYPTTDGVTKGCLFVLNDFSACTITLGNRLDVEIDGATTFKWRVNGGAWTTLEPISMSGNDVDGGAITLYWLAESGFTVTNQFQWTRTDTYGSAVVYLRHRLIANRLFLATGGTLYSIQIAAGDSKRYASTVGYRPVTAEAIGFDQGHLFVAKGSVLLSSDLNNYDVFTATDVNEADSYSIYQATERSLDVYALNEFAIYAIEVFQNRTFLFTTHGIYYADYMGLPAPYSFKFLGLKSIPRVYGNVATLADSVVYFYTDKELCKFDGSSVEVVVDFSLLGLTTATYAVATRIVYNPYEREVAIVFSQGSANFAGRMFVYNEVSKTTYLRYIDLSSASYYSLHVDYAGKYRIGASSRRIFLEDTAWAQTPAYDSGNGTTYGTPTVCTQLIGGNITKAKETNQFHLAVTPTTGTSTKYSVAAYSKIWLKWYNSTDGLISGTASTSTDAFWTSAVGVSGIDLPRMSYRFLALQLELTGTNGALPCGALTIQSIETQLYEADKTTR